MTHIDNIIMKLGRLGMFLVRLQLVYTSFRLAEEVGKGHVRVTVEQPSWV